jgi:hypothetical protein
MDMAAALVQRQQVAKSHSAEAPSGHIQLQLYRKIYISKGINENHNHEYRTEFVHTITTSELNMVSISEAYAQGRERTWFLRLFAKVYYF